MQEQHSRHKLHGCNLWDRWGMCRSNAPDGYTLWLSIRALSWLSVFFSLVCDFFWWGLSLCARKQWSRKTWYPASLAHDRSCDKLLCTVGKGKIWWRFHPKMSKTMTMWMWWLNKGKCQSRTLKMTKFTNWFSLMSVFYVTGCSSVFLHPL